MASLVIGLTGGIGAGKSTVAALLAERGAAVIDVDALGRDVLEPGGEAYAGVIAAFGEQVLAADGTVDRAELAAAVFGPEGRLDELEAISHPAINKRLAERLGDTSRDVIVLDMAVLAESRLGRSESGPMWHRIIVVETAIDVRLPRLVDRGMTEDEARRRIETQASDLIRRRLADLIIPNDGSQEDLHHVVALFWPTIEAWRAQVADEAGP